MLATSARMVGRRASGLMVISAHGSLSPLNPLCIDHILDLSQVPHPQVHIPSKPIRFVSEYVVPLNLLANQHVPHSNSRLRHIPYNTDPCIGYRTGACPDGNPACPARALASARLI